MFIHVDEIADGWTELTHEMAISRWESEGGFSLAALDDGERAETAHDLGAESIQIEREKSR